MPLTPPDRGYPFVALAVLIVVIASPVVSLGGTALARCSGSALAALTVCFLWLERLPLRPGLGVAGLLAVALVGALPLAAAADRGEPWFDYRSFAESLGPDDPVRFSWAQSYGPIDWPRDGNEVMRVVSGEPLYWKARNLDDFNGVAWTARSEPPERRLGERRSRPTCPRTGRTAPRVDARRSRSASGACGRRRDRRGHDRRRHGPVARRRARRSRPAPGTRRARCAATTPTRPRSTSRGPTAAAARRGDLRRGRAPGRRARAHGAVQARARSRAAEPRRASRARPGPVTEAEVHFAAVGRRRASLRRLPVRAPLGVRRRRA